MGESENSEEESSEVSITSTEENDSEGEDDLKIERYNFNNIKLDSFVLVIGKRRYGKTTWTEWLLSKIWQYFPDGGYVFTKTKQNHCNHSFSFIGLK
jgi:hypothetical protein